MRKVTAPDAILQLVEKFDRNRDAYRSGKYAVSRRPLAHLRQIAATDRQIDQLVYESYGLTKGEIRIVEGGRE